MTLQLLLFFSFIVFFISFYFTFETRSAGLQGVCHHDWLQAELIEMKQTLSD